MIVCIYAYLSFLFRPRSKSSTNQSTTTTSVNPSLTSRYKEDDPALHEVLTSLTVTPIKKQGQKPAECTPKAQGQKHSVITATTVPEHTASAINGLSVKVRTAEVEIGSKTTRHADINGTRKTQAHAILSTSFTTKQSTQLTSDIPAGVRLPQRKGGMHLWQFLYSMLLSENYHNLIEWTTNKKEFEFRLLEPEAIAVWWGFHKNKRNMSYDKLSRSLRYYYDKHIIRKISGERYVYRFCVDPELMYKAIGNSDNRPQLKPMPSTAVKALTTNQQQATLKDESKQMGTSPPYVAEDAIVLYHNQRKRSSSSFSPEQYPSSVNVFQYPANPDTPSPLYSSEPYFSSQDTTNLYSPTSKRWCNMSEYDAQNTASYPPESYHHETSFFPFTEQDLSATAIPTTSQCYQPPPLTYIGANETGGVAAATYLHEQPDIPVTYPQIPVLAENYEPAMDETAQGYFSATPPHRINGSTTYSVYSPPPGLMSTVDMYGSEYPIPDPTLAPGFRDSMIAAPPNGSLLSSCGESSSSNSWPHLYNNDIIVSNELNW